MVKKSKRKKIYLEGFERGYETAMKMNDIISLPVPVRCAKCMIEYERSVDPHNMALSTFWLDSSTRHVEKEHAGWVGVWR